MLKISNSRFYLFPTLVTSLWLALASISNAQSFVEPTLENTLLLSQQPILTTPTLTSPQQFNSGSSVSLNGRNLPTNWHQWQSQGIQTEISDIGVMQLGIELLNTKDATKQPVQWFSQPTTKPLVLNTRLAEGHRYLNITQLAKLLGWQISTIGKTLQITTPSAQIKGIRQGKQTWGDRIVIDLDRPTFWQITQQPPPAKPKPLTSESKAQPRHQEWVITVSAKSDLSLIERFNSQNKSLSSQTQLLKVETKPTLTTIRFSAPPHLSPRVSTLANPERLAIDLRPDAMVERDILWASGLHWRQQFINLDTSRFPVVWLEIDPGTIGLSIKPIWSQATTLVGIAPLLKTANGQKAVAAINGGFFNRNNKLPLGALRRDGKWLSSPILNRGAIAWNQTGKFRLGRLKLQETAITSTGERLPISTLNSGYVQAGIARYTSTWGSTYTPLIDQEIVVVVQNNFVTAQLPGGKAGKTAFPIPSNGYLLILRSRNAIAKSLPIGNLINLETTTQPVEFADYPQILGAGPVLLQNRQIVLDAKAEGFSNAFSREKAARSGICTTASGNVLIAAIHNRVNGAGPTLAENAKLMQQMGCIDALNLDGGSSTSLYLGGQLINRSPLTAARVHNGLGIFLAPKN